MVEAILLLDLGIVAAAFLSGYLWFRASRRRLRRVSRRETFDQADLNRIIINLNRSQILNSRAAAATAIAAILAALRLVIGVFGLG